MRDFRPGGLQIIAEPINIEWEFHGELLMKTWTHPGGNLRKVIKSELASEIAEIDGIVKKIIERK